MSSAITRDLGAARQIVDSTADRQLVNEKMRRLGLSETQVELNRLYAYFRTQHNDECQVAWDGSPQLDALSRQSIASTSVLPPGYQDIGNNLSSLPLRYRRPSVPCQLVHVIVKRFSELLYSEQQNPSWKVAGDADTESWVAAVSKQFGLWAEMTMVRDMGGAMGTGIVGFKIIDGAVVFENFDRRWCFPAWNPAKPGKLAKLEIRYMFPKEERDKETGEWVENKYWFRRTIDDEVDCLWKPQPVGDGSTEPDWDSPSTVEEGGWIKHGFGFCPVYWIPNLKVSDSVDGDPDCHGAYDYVDRIAELDSQAHKSALKNADPTPVLSSDGNFDRITLGTDSAIKTEKGGSATYMETSGAAAETAGKQADRLQKKALQVARCVLPDEEGGADGGPVTATEINKRTASMFAKASLLRQSYGNAVKTMMGDLIAVARKLGKGVQAEQDSIGPGGTVIRKGTIVKQAIVLPQKKNPDQEDGFLPEVLGNASGASLELVWPPFSQPTAADTLTKVQGTVQARAGRIVSQETAVRHVASDFNVEDPKAEIERLKKEPQPGADLAAQSLTELNEGR